MSFEAELKRLEEIVGELEADEIALDRALALFEEGVTRLRSATELLAHAEGRIQRLVERADGSIEVVTPRA